MAGVFSGRTLPSMTMLAPEGLLLSLSTPRSRFMSKDTLGSRPGCAPGVYGLLDVPVTLHSGK